MQTILSKDGKQDDAKERGNTPNPLAAPSTPFLFLGQVGIKFSFDVQDNDH